MRNPESETADDFLDKEGITDEALEMMIELAQTLAPYDPAVLATALLIGLMIGFEIKDSETAAS